MSPPDPRLVANQALAKALDLENRINLLAAGPPIAPSLIYTPGTTVVTQSSAGTFTWTCPAGVTSAKIECWAAGAGGGGGSASTGGEGSGGGEYACEPNYPVVPGNVYNYTIGGGGIGGTTFNGGNTGGDSVFDNGGVFANGGNAGSGFTGGLGGSGSPNTIANAGGNGGGTGSQGTGGCGGGGSGGSNGSGFNGSTSSSSVGVGGGAGGSGTSGGGGGGGSAAANGVNGLIPGGGGGGAGASTGSGTQFTKDYQGTSSGSYYGSDATGGNANGFKGYGTLWQGGETASGGSYNGTQRGLLILPSGISSDLSGATIDKISLRLLNLSSWYNNGMYVILGYGGNTSLPGTYAGIGATGVKQYWVINSQTNVTDLTNTGLGAALQSGAARALVFGPGTPGFNLYNYGSLYGAGGASGSVPDLRVEYHTGSAPVQAGAGHDGQVRISYNTPGLLTASLQPVAGTDTSSNAFAAGYTGPTNAFQPGQSPAVVEAPHSFTSPVNYLVTATWAVRSGGYLAQFYMGADGRVYFDFELTATGTIAGGYGVGYPITTALPSGYHPGHPSDMALAWFGGTSAARTGQGSATLTFDIGGILTAWNLPAENSTGSLFIQFSGSFPTN